MLPWPAKPRKPSGNITATAIDKRAKMCERSNKDISFGVVYQGITKYTPNRTASMYSLREKSGRLVNIKRPGEIPVLTKFERHKSYVKRSNVFSAGG